jgi:uncharacterized lipoprotein YbaY
VLRFAKAMSGANSVALAGFLALALGCAAGAPSMHDGRPSVQVRLLSSVGSTLPAGDEVELTLADVTGADMPPVVVSTVTYPQVPSKDVLWLPLDLSLAYDAERINPEHTYVVSARVKDAGGTVRFLNLQSVSVLTQGALSRVDVTVDPVQRP